MEQIMTRSVVHIVDDSSWGGVNRLLACFANAPTGFIHDQHIIMRIERGCQSAPLITADVIVSHMSICWKNVPFFSSLRATHPEIPLIHVEHSYSERFVALKVKNRDRFEDLMRLSYALFDKIVAVSTPQAAWLDRRGFAQSDQLVKISSCASLSAFEAVSGQRPSGPVTIGAIGRFHEQKGFDILVDAFVASDHQNAILLLVGDGPDKNNLLKKAKGNTRIVFLPPIDNPASAMSLCDVIAMPSRWEPYGLVAIEAMAARKPVFCSNVDGLKEHIGNGAIVISENTVNCWMQEFAKFSSRDAVAALPIGRGHVKAEQIFTNSWNELISDVVDGERAIQKAA
jgi:D-inositol-3-phosphate glycosyltransferase